MALNETAKLKLDTSIKRHEELQTRLGLPEVVGDPDTLSRLSREFASLETVIQAYRNYEQNQREAEKLRAELEKETDEEMAALFQEELDGLEQNSEPLEQELISALFPQEDVSSKNMILEIRAGAGGLEAAIFVGDLHRMYSRYAELNNWTVEPLNSHASPMGGFKEIAFAVRGRNAYKNLRYESGVHRVQRIPVTESGGRIHTSTSTVAVLVEPDAVEVEIDNKDLKIDTFRASSAGGQHVNKTDSAVRVTHLPTGMVVECQDERSQHQNKAKALRLLRARMLQYAEEQRQQEISEDRRSQVGTGDRSERIRTYNFPQNRISDHRTGVTLYKLAAIMEGDMNELLDSVQEFFHQNGQAAAAGG